MAVNADPWRRKDSCLHGLNHRQDIGLGLQLFARRAADNLRVADMLENYIPFCLISTVYILRLSVLPN